MARLAAHSETSRAVRRVPEPAMDDAHPALGFPDVKNDPCGERPHGRHSRPYQLQQPRAR